jgi:hypothetical protein
MATPILVTGAVGCLGGIGRHKRETGRRQTKIGEFAALIFDPFALFGRQGFD